MDGCLSLEEFLTAMHLVVLRRNSITLPDSLPTCLRPTFLKAKLEHSHKKQLKKEQVCRSIKCNETFCDVVTLKKSYN